MSKLIRMACVLAALGSLPAVVTSQVRLGSLPGGAGLPLAGLSTEPWLEPQVAQADLVVVGKRMVDEGKQQVNVEMRMPGDTVLHTWEMQHLGIEVSKVLLDKSAATSRPAASKPDETKDISVFTPTSLSPWPVDNKGPRPHVLMAMPPEMKVGSSYVLLLRKIDGRSDYYLDPRWRYDADEKTVAEATAACKIEDWPWGKSANGLQACLLVGDKVQGFAQNPQTGPGSMSIPAYFVLRNTGKQPVRLMMGPGTTATLLASRPDSKLVSEPAFRAASYEEEIKPGAMAVLGYAAHQPSLPGVQIKDIAPGKWTFTFTISAVESAKAGVWSGMAESGGVARDVTFVQPTPLIR